MTQKGYSVGAKNDPELEKSDATNFGNLLKLLWYRVEGGDRHIENHFQNAS